VRGEALFGVGVGLVHVVLSGLQVQLGDVHAAGQFGAGIAQQFAGSVVGRDDPALAVEDQMSLGRLFEDPLIARGVRVIGHGGGLNLWWRAGPRVGA